MIRLMRDELSRKLYEARMKFMTNKDEEEFWNLVNSLDLQWYKTKELEEFEELAAGKNIIIYGAGRDGKWTSRTLELFQHKVEAFCDSNESIVGKQVRGIDVISRDELIEHHKDAMVVVSSSIYHEQIFNDLIKDGYDEKSIFVPQHGILFAMCGEQYFDVFEPSEKEIFVDAGAYDGENTVDFYRWAGNCAQASYTMEPFECMKERIINNLNNLPNTHIFFNAAWDKEEELFFDGEERSSGVSEDGQRIEGITIDKMLKGNRVSFIKMDIEGSELAALHGASEVIKKYKPRLAICIYHKPEDIVEIPEYLISLVPEYKFVIRHYTSSMWETVLYASV